VSRGPRSFCSCCDGRARADDGGDVCSVVVGMVGEVGRVASGPLLLVGVCPIVYGSELSSKLLCVAASSPVINDVESIRSSFASITIPEKPSCQSSDDAAGEEDADKV
jgi:hypothetical protein